MPAAGRRTVPRSAAWPSPAPAAPFPVRTGSATTTVARAEAGPAQLAPATTENGLPVRVRQQHTGDPDAGFGLVAPPPREDPALAPLAGPETDARSPDAAGRVMSAFWHGRTRGISAAEHGPGNGAERPADGGI